MHSVDPADLPDTEELRASGNESIVLTADFKVYPQLVQKYAKDEAYPSC